MVVRIPQEVTVGDIPVPPGDYPAKAVREEGGHGSKIVLQGKGVEGVSADRSTWRQLGAEIILGV